MECWSCGSRLENHLIKKISFRDVCERCGVYLHCCQGCKFFQKGLSNDCKIPGTERVSDREKGNFCDDFSSIGRKVQLHKVEKQTKNFEDLFKDS